MPVEEVKPNQIQIETPPPAAAQQEALQARETPKIQEPGNAAPSAEIRQPQNDAPNVAPRQEGVETRITEHPRNGGNTVQAAQELRFENNEVNVNGAGNRVEFTPPPEAPNPAPAQAPPPEAPVIEGANVNITGDRNEVEFREGGQRENTININGNENQVDIGPRVQNLNVNIAANNVQVNVTENPEPASAQNNFNVNVSADNVAVNIQDGAGTVAPREGDAAIDVQIDNKNLSITVSEGVAAIDPIQTQADTIPREVPLPAGEFGAGAKGEIPDEIPIPIIDEDLGT